MDKGDKFLKYIELFCMENARGSWPDFWDAGGAKGIYGRAASVPSAMLPDDEIAAAKAFIDFVLHENPRLYPPTEYPQPSWFPDNCLKWREAVKS